MFLQFMTASLYANATTYYSLKIQPPSGSGSTNPSTGTHSYTSGTSVKVTAYPSSGYRFDHWVKDGSNAGKSNPIYVSMGASHTLKAVFTQTQISTMANYSLTIQSSTASGSTNPVSGVYSYNQGTNVQVSATSASGWFFSYWLLDG